MNSLFSLKKWILALAAIFLSSSAFAYPGTLKIKAGSGLDVFAKNLIEKHVSADAADAVEEVVMSGTSVTLYFDFAIDEDSEDEEDVVVNWSPGGSKGAESDPRSKSNKKSESEKTCRIVMSRTVKGDISVHIDGKLMEGNGGGGFETETSFDVEVPCSKAAKTIRELKDSLNP